MDIAMVGDTVVPLAELPPQFLDHGLYFGDGVYEVLRSYRGRIFALDEHLERFAKSLQAIEITGIDLMDVRERVLRGFAESRLHEAKIYFHVTRGSDSRDRGGRPSVGPNFFLTVTPLTEGYGEEGISVSTQPDLRWKRCDIKSLNLLPNILARRAAAAEGCSEAILVDGSGAITEGAGSAFFAVISSETEATIGSEWLQTAPLTANILPSVTRHYVLRAAQVVNLPVRESSLRPEQMNEASEAFIAVTTHGIVPVCLFDGRPVRTGERGPWTIRLQQAFEAFVHHGAH